MKIFKIVIILFVMCCFTSCKYYYGDKTVTKVNNLNGMVSYEFNYGPDIFTIGVDTILPVGSWQDDNDVWHLPDEK